MLFIIFSLIGRMSTVRLWNGCLVAVSYFNSWICRGVVPMGNWLLLILTGKTDSRIMEAIQDYTLRFQSPRFLQRAGSRLRILRLENCPFLSNESLYWISTICTGLQGITFVFLIHFAIPWFLFSGLWLDLSLRGCRHLEPTAFWPLGCLPNLERLVLDDTFIETPTLFVFLQSFNNLLQLSVGN